MMKTISSVNPVMMRDQSVTPLPGKRRSTIAKSVADTIKIEVSDAQMAMLRRIDSENYEGIAKKAELDLRLMGKTPIDAGRAIYALKQYYVLAAINPLNMHAVADIVDPYWHAHVLHTEKYERFCLEAVGYFMHHYPLDHDRSEQITAAVEIYDYTLDVLKILFSEDLDPECWPSKPALARIVCCHGNRSLPRETTVKSFHPPNERLLAMRDLVLAIS